MRANVVASMNKHKPKAENEVIVYDTLSLVCDVKHNGTVGWSIISGCLCMQGWHSVHNFTLPAILIC